MIVFSAFLVVVAIGLLIAGVVTSKLWLVYLAIGVSGFSLLALGLGAILRRDQLFGKARPAEPAPPYPVPAQVPGTAAPRGQSGLDAFPEPAAAPAGSGWSAGTQSQSVTTRPPAASFPPAPSFTPAASFSPAPASFTPAVASFGPVASFPEAQPVAPAPAPPATESQPPPETDPLAQALLPPDRLEPASHSSPDAQAAAGELSPDEPAAHAAAEPQAADSQAAELQAADSQAAEPQAAEPHQHPQVQQEPERPEPASTPDEQAPGPGEVDLLREVTVVPGVPRYHNPPCILIRFMGEEDLNRMPLGEARQGGCTPCRACQPEQP